MRIARGQELETTQRDHRPTADPQGVDRDAEEGQDVGPGPQRPEHDQERIEADPRRDLRSIQGAEVLGEAIKDQRPADRIDDREQGRESDQKCGIRCRGEAAPVRHAQDVLHARPHFDEDCVNSPLCFRASPLTC